MKWFNKKVVVNLNMPSKMSTGTGSKVMINLTDNKLQFKLNNYTKLICSSNEKKNTTTSWYYIQKHQKKSSYINDYKSHLRILNKELRVLKVFQKIWKQKYATL